MKCPHCNVNLLMTDKQGVEIDYCPECRGIWLDRGELEKIIERSAKEYGNLPQNPVYKDDYKHQSHKHSYEDSHYGHHGDRKHHKKSFLQDIFDF